MLYLHYTLFVRERAGLETEASAQKAIAAVLQVLGTTLSPEQSEALAETIPLEARVHMAGSRWRHTFGLVQFLERVAWLEGVDTATAERHAVAVLSVLAEYLPSPALLAALDGLPGDMRGLFNWMKKAA